MLREVQFLLDIYHLFAFVRLPFLMIYLCVFPMHIACVELVHPQYAFALSPVHTIRVVDFKTTQHRNHNMQYATCSNPKCSHWRRLHCTSLYKMIFLATQYSKICLVLVFHTCCFIMSYLVKISMNHMAFECEACWCAKQGYF